jgi:hypothetical protein
MSHKNYAEKHSPDRKVNEKLAQALREKALDREIPCALAFNIAETMKVSPAEVGFTLDMLEIKTIKCQLGLFGYKPNKRIVQAADNVSPELEEAIRNSLTNGRLPCAVAWELAERFGLRKMQVSAACETLGIKISACQLGSF